MSKEIQGQEHWRPRQGKEFGLSPMNCSFPKSVKALWVVLQQREIISNHVVKNIILLIFFRTSNASRRKSQCEAPHLTWSNSPVGYKAYSILSSFSTLLSGTPLKPYQAPWCSLNPRTFPFSILMPGMLFPGYLLAHSLTSFKYLCTFHFTSDTFPDTNYIKL